MAEEHTHSYRNDDYEHSYAHDHEDGHMPHHHDDGDQMIDIWEEGDDEAE